MTDSDNGSPETGPREEDSPAPAESTSTADPDGESVNADAAAEEVAAKAKAEAAAKAKAEAAAKAKAEAAKPAWEKDPVTPEWIEAADDPLVESVRVGHPDAVTSAQTLAGDLVLEISRDEVRDICRTLKEQQGYTLLVDILGVHFPDREDEPFEVVYILYSLDANRRVRLKVRTSEGVDIPSVTPVFAGANWPEREVFDMYGVGFAQHPDMTRILLWEGFNGHPLRKDFPIEGIDTGAAIYPEFYEESAGPVAGTGTGWRPPESPDESQESAEPTDTTGDGR